MPTSTFFRLPEEKRVRLIEACWTELTRVQFSEVSVNRIISEAHIPRGSFYQYFEDKDDMISYLLRDMREYFIDLLRNILIHSKGDMFAIPLGCYDHFIHCGTTDPILMRFIRVLKLNPGLDTQNLMLDSSGFLPDCLWELVDRSRLKKETKAYAEHIFYLVCAVLAYAVAGTLQDSSQEASQREMLKERVVMLQYGCAAQNQPDNKEAAK